MMFTAYLVLTALASIFLGGICSLVALFKSVRQEYSQLAIASFVSLAFSWAPLVVGVWGFGYLLKFYKLELSH